MYKRFSVSTASDAKRHVEQKYRMYEFIQEFGGTYYVERTENRRYGCKASHYTGWYGSWSEP